MSIKNSNVMPGNDGRTTHKRFPKQAKTRKAFKRLRSLSNPIVSDTSGASKEEVGDVRS